MGGKDLKIENTSKVELPQSQRFDYNRSQVSSPEMGYAEDYAISKPPDLSRLASHDEMASRSRGNKYGYFQGREQKYSELQVFETVTVSSM